MNELVEIEKKDGVPMCTLEQYEVDFADRHLVHGVVQKWAKEKPDEIGLICADDGREFSWKAIYESSTAIAMKLTEMGFQKGDFLATSLSFLPEHIFLEYACFQIGVIHVPLDMRLKPPEVIRCLSLVKAKAYCHLGKTPIADFAGMGKAVQENCSFVEHFIQFSSPDECNEGAISAFTLAKEAETLAREVLSGNAPEIAKKCADAKASVVETDGCQVIYTTGSTGFPKPALLSHRGITSQNLTLGMGFDMTEKDTMCVNLPPSHVGGQAEQLMTPWFFGGKCVVLHVFKPDLTLEMIQKYKITLFGQIPALFAMEWRLPNYAEYDLSSLKFALYGGQAVTREFLEKLSQMVPRFGTGLGLTETSGFCTYTPLDGTVDDILAGVGYAMPITPISIREPIREDGRAGKELPEGEVGEICFSGPQLFLGYVNNEEATRKTISSDGWLYTGDLGSYDEKGLHLAGRSKLMIKPKGYNVFPTEVENFISNALREKVAGVACVGVKHEIFTEAIFAFVVPHPGKSVTPEEVFQAAKEIASYKRPSHVEIIPEMPLNRVAKTDYVTLKEEANRIVEKLRASGKWDT
ncbi:MAG: class I adenylate-forming enzyme family protein [Candidatus Thorarchaeota archaeon]